MDQHTFFEMLFTTAVASIAGGMTDTTSIFLLFRPYEPRGIGPFKIQGALPKNKTRLAHSIGKTVGERLLTSEDLHARLNAPAVRETFADAIGQMFDTLVDQDRGSLRSHFSPTVSAAFDRALTSVAPRVAGRLAEHLRSAEGVAQMAGWLEHVRDEVKDQPVAELLTPERHALIRTKLGELATQFVEGEELERTLRRFVATQSDELAHDDRPLMNRLPAGFIGAIEQAITDYIPIALDRLGALLSDPEARTRIEAALRDAFDSSVRDLMLHERLLAKLMVTDRTIERLVDGFEREGFDRFAQAFEGPEMRDQLARAVREAVINFLLVPASERLDRLGDERRDAVAESLGDWLVTIAREPGTRRVVDAAASRALEALERRTWGEVLGSVRAEKVATFAAGALAGEQGQRVVETLVRGLVERLLDQPIGRPADWLGPEMRATLREGMIEEAWKWVQAQIPRLVQQIRVQEIIEQKVNDLPIERVEHLIRDVSQKELDLIVKIGYVLGGIFGFGAFWLGKLVGL